MQNIVHLPPEEQHYIGEIIEIGEEALEDAGVGTTGAIDIREVKDESMTDAEKIKQNLESYFSSKILARHIETASKGDFELKSEFIGDIVQYGILFPDATPDDIDKYANAQSINRSQRHYDGGLWQGTQKAMLITKEVARTLGIAPDNIEEHKEDIARYVYDHYETNGFVFHGFNSAFEGSIKQYGLSTEEREQDNSEIQKIESLFIGHGVEYMTGARTVQKENSYFVSDTPSVSYSYAKSSPEWFEYFTGGGHTFINRDYEAAQHYVQKRTAEAGMNSSNQQYVMDFFERHWKLLAENATPMLALVKRSAIDYAPDDFTSEYKIQTTTWDGKPEPITAAEIVQSLLSQHANVVDREIHKTAPPESITMITLPR